ncbi:male-specific lethal 3 homolog isoform X2 [Xenia sp. Carnegie-2017]|uniref:male-specific lethal 3 homolog isoform X2 n=1 Tax=Xenia sp. Carnegie-2017 TaxID=2897299 RepID=UPI001F04A168|nr:male-specific lethal 3 homolog isoform X2 [Xenia sp. Carnegie-2017]
MVSTRQDHSAKYSTGETVLCYEPDESKAKVLYESKILEVDFTKDDKGKRVPEYFVHFSGWNKSWDRWVMEDQILPSTDFNRQKMKRLHEEAISRLKSKRKRKMLGAVLKHSLQSNNFNESSSFSQSTSTPSPLNSLSTASIEIEIPSAIKLKLEDNCYLIRRKKKLVGLPRSPNVLDILKDYINHVTLRESQQQTTDALSSIKIVKEVMDGVRVYFDFTLSSLLLYNIERDQHEKIMSGPQARQENNIKKKPHFENVKKHESKELKDDESNNRILRRRSKRQSVNASTTSSVSLDISKNVNSNMIQDTVHGNEGKCKTKKGTKRKRSSQCLPMKNDVNNVMESDETPSPISPSQVYGVEHLIRLFVKLPSLLTRTTIEEKKLTLLMHHLKDFLSYLSTRINTLTSEDVYEDNAVF